MGTRRVQFANSLCYGNYHVCHIKIPRLKSTVLTKHDKFSFRLDLFGNEGRLHSSHQNNRAFRCIRKGGHAHAYTGGVFGADFF